MRQETEGMVYDLDFLSLHWPNILQNSWINISEPDEKNITFATLINNNQYLNKEIITDSLEFSLTIPMVARISWEQFPEEKFAMVKTLTVFEEYQGYDIGYWIGSAMKTYLAYYRGINLLPPPIEHRNIAVNNMLKKWCIEYQDDFTKFLDDDGIYYTYSEWINKTN